MRRQRMAAFDLLPVPSRYCLALVLAVSALACGLLLTFASAAAICLLPLPFYVGYLLRCDGWLGGRRAAERVTVDGGGHVVFWRGGTRFAVQVADDSLVLPWLIVLAVRGAGRRMTLVLWPDSAGREAQRQLAVYLRCFLEPA
ncbi:protein YgfX [Paludibacterium yongneupense]|uniref:protein YgfX n=1 Tax=Paludibacterium yongneupense TaxID=400061 RepID=UPI00041D8BB6|nr:protein YgfX [Paludibacterium yongneupense]